MYSYATHDELEWLLAECETALSTVRKTINAYPSDLIAKVALPALQSSLEHLVKDLQGRTEKRPLSTEQFDRLCWFLRQSRVSIIHPQARKIGFKVPRLTHTTKGWPEHSDLGTALRVLILFLAQGLAFGLLDRFQTSPPWAGNHWVPHTASLLVTYFMVLHHLTSWTPTFCFVAAQGFCVWMSCDFPAVDLRGMLGLLLQVLPTRGLVTGSWALVKWKSWDVPLGIEGCQFFDRH
jgi:hypothetical protein